MGLFDATAFTTFTKPRAWPGFFDRVCLADIDGCAGILRRWLGSGSSRHWDQWDAVDDDRIDPVLRLAMDSLVDFQSSLGKVSGGWLTLSS